MPTNELDHNLSLPAGQWGRALAALREDQWFERKSRE